MIRPYEPGDLDRLKEITTICFEGVSIDRNIEERFGLVGGHDWRWRKSRHIDQDVADAHAGGVFVYVDEASGQVGGYVSCRLDGESKIGWIPNLAVDPPYQGRGIGRELMTHVIEYLRAQGMECAKIETLTQNPVGTTFYPGLGFEEVARQIHYVMRLGG